MKNTETGEVSEFFGSWSAYQEHLSENPQLQTVIGAPRIVSGTGSVTENTSKIPDGFKDKLREIKKKHPESTGVDHLI